VCCILGVELGVSEILAQVSSMRECFLAALFFRTNGPKFEQTAFEDDPACLSSWTSLKGGARLKLAY